MSKVRMKGGKKNKKPASVSLSEIKTHAHEYTHTRVHCIHGHAHALMHICMHVWIHACAHSYAESRIHAHKGKGSRQNAVGVVSSDSSRALRCVYIKTTHDC